MFEKFLMPLDRQFDDGYEVTAEAFRDAAVRLSEHEGKLAFANSHLPINFLYRHALELYLKSAIFTVHRALNLPSGDGPHTAQPLIRIDGKWKAVHKTHSVKSLIDELTRLLTDHKAELSTKTPRNWETPSELIEWIDTIEAADSGSTYFRYPSRNGTNVDAEKSGFLPVDPGTLIAETKTPQQGQRGKVILGLKDDDGNLTEVFAMCENPLPELRDALVKAVEMMSGCAFGLHAELVCGYGKQGFAALAEETNHEPTD